MSRQTSVFHKCVYSLKQKNIARCSFAIKVSHTRFHSSLGFHGLQSAAI